ncbi:hypothetical protein BDR07DRAFT_251578 [Suillus spraguei]|nr:hypothetical protein BDR07DRAFT_251578 [Suillus spraguei]
MLKYKPRFQYIFLTVPRVQLNLNVASFPCRGRPGPVLDPIHNLQRQPTCKRLRRRQHEPTQKQIYPVSADIINHRCCTTCRHSHTFTSDRIPIAIHRMSFY